MNSSLIALPFNVLSIASIGIFVLTALGEEGLQSSYFANAADEARPITEVSVASSAVLADTDNSGHQDALAFDHSRLGFSLSGDAGLHWKLEGKVWMQDGSVEDLEWRQAWFTYSFRSTEISGGRKVMAFGRADRINPTDLVSPRHLVRYESIQHDERQGTDFMALAHTLGHWTLRGITIPWLGMHVLRMPQSDAALQDSIPLETSNHPSWLFRIDRPASEFDFSVSGYYGSGLIPVFAPSSSQPWTLAIKQPRTFGFGGDFSLTLNPHWGLRGEGFATFFQRQGLQGLAPGDFFNGVLGVECIPLEGWLALLQWNYRFTPDYAEPLHAVKKINALNWMQENRHDHLTSISFSRTGLENRLTGNIGAAVHFEPIGYYAFTEARLVLADPLHLRLRIEKFSGESGSALDHLRDYSFGLIEIKAATSF